MGWLTRSVKGVVHRVELGEEREGCRCTMVLGGTVMAGEVKDMDKLLRARSMGTGPQDGLTAAGARANLEAAFIAADADGSGQISREELLNVLTVSLEMVFPDPAEDCATIFDVCDQDASGEIDFKEFCAVMESTIVHFDQLKEGGGGKMDMQVVMTQAFQHVLTDARKERACVIESFGQAVATMEKSAKGITKGVMGSKWRLKMADEFYHNNSKVPAHKRLQHLKERLRLTAAGEEPWVDEMMEQDEVVKREVMDKKVFAAYAKAWLLSLEEKIKDVGFLRAPSLKDDTGV